ncbi:MAG TPA: tetratricopeptide repeat protein [Opitutaceae bacterium]|nr:tetratricopeptide repeat protein [Opitutaceae bacterium]
MSTNDDAVAAVPDVTPLMTRILRCGDFWLGAALFGLVLAAYWPAVNGGFIWNDSDYVTRVGLRSMGGLARIWFRPGATEQYYPLLHSAFWFEHKLWGDHPAGYHLLNILLHATSACLLLAVLRRLSVPGAWLAAFLFALHPVYVESVAWISEQKNTLSTVFYLAAALSYLRFDETRRRAPYLLASGFFALSLLSKTVPATLPAALLVIFWWKRGRLSWSRDVGPLLPWFAVGAAMGLFTGWVERHYVGATGPDFDLTFGQRGLLAGRVVWFYLGKLLWPADLIFFYPRWKISTGETGQYLFPLATLALVAVAWSVRRKNRAPLAAVLFFVGSLFPTSGFFNLYAFIYSFVADHWQYLPSIGILVLVAAGLTVAWRSLPPAWQRAGPPFAVLLAGVLALLSWRQSRMYTDMKTFYLTTLRRNPGCWIADNNLGSLLLDEGNVVEAMGYFQKTLALKADYAPAHNNLGNALAELGRTQEALPEYREAIRLKSDFFEAHYNLGLALSALNRVPEAMAEYETVLRDNPYSADAHYNLGVALAGLNRLPEAAAQYEEVLRLDPNEVDARNNLGGALAQMGRLPDAIVQFQTVVEQRPDDIQARRNLGNALYLAGRLPAAAAQFQEVLRLDPADAQARNMLNQLLARTGPPPK